MYDFLADHALYVVLLIAVICWVGIFGYLVRLDRRIADLEQRTKQEGKKA